MGLLSGLYTSWPCWHHLTLSEASESDVKSLHPHCVWGCLWDIIVSYLCVPSVESVRTPSQIAIDALPVR